MTFSVRDKVRIGRQSPEAISLLLLRDKFIREFETLIKGAKDRLVQECLADVKKALAHVHGIRKGDPGEKGKDGVRVVERIIEKPLTKQELRQREGKLISIITKDISRKLAREGIEEGNLVDIVLNTLTKRGIVEDSLISKIRESMLGGSPTPEGAQEPAKIPTAEEIANKVFKLIATKGLPLNAIQGLPERLKALDQNIKTVKSRANKQTKGGGGGGGGMGNVITESFPVTSATTSITLMHRIASRGGAIWLYYNGVEQRRGTDYTPSAQSKVVALNFTPDDTTPTSYIDVTYVRT